MATTNIQYPNITPTTKDGNDIRNYLYQLVDELNFSVNGAISSGGNSTNIPIHLYAKTDYVDKSIERAILNSWGGSY